jgi:hypothetical protein
MTAGRRVAADRVVLGLGALLAIQFGVMLGRSSPNPSAVVQAVVPGVSVRDLRVTGSSGTVPSIDGPALLLAFHSECAHCLRVSPQWSEWIGNYGSSGVLAISREDLGVAERYALDRGWNVAVGSVEVADARGVEAALVSRTAWIYVVDAEGIVQASGHGNRIDELGAIFQDLAEAHAPGRGR